MNFTESLPNFVTIIIIVTDTMTELQKFIVVSFNNKILQCNFFNQFVKKLSARNNSKNILVETISKKYIKQSS